jgi:mRNA interferase MazF
VRRGEIWSVAGGRDYTGKPRPVAILQDNRFEELRSVTFCPFTTNPTPAPLFRVPVTPSERNRLKQGSSLMVDKITTVGRRKVGKRIGRRRRRRAYASTSAFFHCASCSLRPKRVLLAMARLAAAAYLAAFLVPGTLLKASLPHVPIDPRAARVRPGAHEIDGVDYRGGSPNL